MLKKCNIVCYGGLPLLNSSAALSSPPSSRPGVRSYATAHEYSGSELSWPIGPSFTPYDIFKQERNAPYSKSRFYELVKIYHPDRPCAGHPLCKDITPEVRLQRYRLVVSANDILSDPKKRGEYDKFGKGWSHNPSPPRNPYPTPSWAQPGSRDWNPIYANATWEDWERWYRRHQPKQRHTVDQRTFATLVILLAMFGGALQASWISHYTTGYDDRLREVNDESVRFLAGRKENVNQMASSEAKVQHFLIRRDPSGFGLKEDELPLYRKILNPRKLPPAKEVESVEPRKKPAKSKKTTKAPEVES